jgi:hypothetical protein
MTTKKGSHPALWGILILGTVLVTFLAFQLLSDTSGPPRLGEDDTGETNPGSQREIISRIDGPWTMDSGTETEPVKELIEDIEPVSDQYLGIRARLVDAFTREPITRCTIWYCNEATDTIEVHTPPGRTRTLRDANGELRLYGLEEGTYSIGVKAAGYLEYIRKGLEVPQEEKILLFELSRGTFIEGKVITRDQEPIPGMTVLLDFELDNPQDAPPARRAAQTDSRGAFLFGGLPPGRYSLYLKSFSDPLAVEKGIFLPQGGKHTATLYMPDLATVEFQVSDEWGKAIVSAGIHFMRDDGDAPFSVRTDRYGKASLRFVPPGNYNLRISKRTYEYIIEPFKILGGSDIIRINRTMLKKK